MTNAPGDRGDGIGAARAVFFGSGPFGLPVLEALRTAREVVLVGIVSAPDRSAGRNGEIRAVPIAARARELGLTLLQPDKVRSAQAIAEVADLHPAVGILADYGQIIPPELLALSVHGILNLHPSLLPRHRGAAPIPATILAGDPATGVTIIQMDAGLDTGPIVAATRWPLTGTETAPELEARAAVEGAALLARTIVPWLRGDIASVPQGDDGVTMTRPLRRDDGRLDPDRPAQVLERQVRAFQPWPGSFLETSAGRLIVWRASVEGEAATAAAPGTFGPGPDLRIATVDGWLVLSEVQPAGGRRMPGTVLLRGRPALASSRVV